MYLSIFHDIFSYIRTSIFFYLKTKKCTVFRVNVPYFYTSVPGKVDRMLAGLHTLDLCEVGMLVLGCYLGWGWSSVGTGGVEEAKTHRPRRKTTLFLFTLVIQGLI